MLGVRRSCNYQESPMTNQLECYDEATPNPLDSVEDVLSDYNWVYSRTNNQNLIVDIAGKSCNYHLSFVWQERIKSLQLCCEYDLIIRDNNMRFVADILMDINTSLWIGHFEIKKNSHQPRFRQTCLITEHDHKSGYNHIEALVDISLIQCEQYQHVFHILANNDDIDLRILSLAMMETAGES